MRFKRILYLISIVFVFICTSYLYSASNQTYGNIVVSRLVSVYDGDTFRVDIDSFPPIIGSNMPIRIYGLDTPEIRGTRTKELADRAKSVTRSMLKKAKVIELRDMRRGKYFRIIADVWVDGKNLGQYLIDQGLAKPYFGGKRAKW